MNNFIAVVEEDHMDRINEIADSLREMGTNVKNVGKYTGVITGSTSKELCDLKISGIKSVEPDRKISAL